MAKRMKKKRKKRGKEASPAFRACVGEETSKLKAKGRTRKAQIGGALGTCRHKMGIRRRKTRRK